MPVPRSEYSAWSSCGLGSTVAREDVKEIAPGVKIISSTSMTLAAVEKDKVVLDMVVRNHIDGASASIPPTEILQEVEIPAELPEIKASSEGGSELGFAPDPAAPRPSPLLEGDETLTIAGTEVPCHWTEYVVRGTSRMTVRTWTSDRIPGGLARAQVRVEGASVQESTTRVVAFEKKPL